MIWRRWRVSRRQQLLIKRLTGRQEKEDAAEGNRGAQRSGEHDEGEDHPALRAGGISTPLFDVARRFLLTRRGRNPDDKCFKLVTKKACRSEGM